MYRIRRTRDVCLVRELHKKLFPGDPWIGDDKQFWVAYDSTGTAVGFASAAFYRSSKYVSFSRCGVDKGHTRNGLQRRLLQARMRWARKAGARGCVTYVHKDNYPSLCNLVRAGFWICRRPKMGWRRFLPLFLPFIDDEPVPNELISNLLGE